jgi:hypothetical protein
MGFPSEHTAVKHVFDTLPSCANLGTVSCLKRSFPLTLDVINDNDWSVCSFISYIFADPMLYEAINSLWLSALSSLLMVSSY